MKELAYVFAEGLHKGLRHTPKSLVNNQALITCYNTRCGKSGLEEYTAIASPFTGLPAIVFPYPRLFSTKTGLYVVNSVTTAGVTTDQIYKVNPNYSLTSVISSLKGGQNWSLADFGDYQLWTNGYEKVIRSPGNGLFTAVTDPNLKAFNFNCVCNFRGQIVAGGSPPEQTNLVFWGDIGSADINLMLNSLRKNTIGNMPMPWKKGGEVYAIKELGDMIMIYGSNGISAIFPITTPVPAFGLMHLKDFGIANAEAIAGDELHHLIVDEAGKAWLIDVPSPMTKFPKFTELDYHEWFAPMLTGTVVVSYDPNLGDFYISDGTSSYLLTSNGLSKVFQRPTSIAPLAGSLIGVRSESTDVYFEAVSDHIDLSNRNIKTLDELEIAITNVTTPASTVTAAVDYLYSGAGAFVRSSYKPVNIRGIVHPVVSGLEFRIAVKVTSYVGVSLDSIIVSWKQSDKRGLRRNYVT